MGRVSKTMVLTSLMLILFSTVASARLSNIVKENLHLNTELESVLAQIETIENMVYVWTPEWNYAKPKEEVIELITSGYKMLEEHTTHHLENKELYLLMGLLAHYGYQLDLADFYQLAENAYARAAAVDPDDFRPKWFMAMHQLKAALVIEGMDTMLALAAEYPPAELPPEFWEDYAYGALLAWMPSHAAMALTYAHESLGYAGYMERLIGGIVQNRFLPPPEETSVENEKLWEVYRTEDGFNLVNRLFGFSLITPEDWEVRLGPVQNRNVSVLIKPPGKKGFQTNVLPTILIFSRLPEQGETLEDFLQEVFRSSQSLRELSSTPEVKTYELESAELYPAEGGGYCYVTGIQRRAPRFPGVLLEKPISISRNGDGEGVRYYAAEQVYRRFEG